MNNSITDKERRLILDLLRRYKETFLSVPLSEDGADEIYKWHLITECQGKNTLAMIESLKEENIVDIQHVKPVLLDLISNSHDKLATVFEILTDEKTILNERLASFKKAMDALCGDKFKVKANDERTAAAFLACWRPEKYTFYKNEIYKNYCNYIGEQPKQAGEKYHHFLHLLQPLSQAIKDDAELRNKYETETKGLIQSDLLNAQNILWQMKDMMIEEKKQFTWIPFYTELAEKLLEYKSRRKELIEFIFSKEGLLEFSDYLHLEDKTKKIDDIDPFSFMGMFNRGNLSSSNRVRILTKIKQQFEIVADVPSDFDGIPVLNRARMFFYNWNELHQSCQKLWEVYEQLHNGNISPWFEYYNFYNRRAECTMPLFWCNAKQYIALDSRNRDYLQSQGILVDVTDASSYLALLQNVKEDMKADKLKEKSFEEISYNAWKIQYPKKYWLYAPGENAQFWDEFYKEGIMGIGWEELGDLSEYHKKSDLKSSMINVYGKKDGPKAYMNYVQCSWDFVHEMHIGDVVFVKQGKWKILGFGIVNSDYYYDESRKFYNSIRKVCWKKKGEWEHPGDAALKTLTDVTPNPDYVNKLKQLFLMSNEINNYTEILRHKKNIILQGAPGTGKTYNTAALALSICGVTGVDLNDHIEVMKCYEQMRYDERTNPTGQIAFCTFHQSMDYEDFVEGIKPNTDDGTVTYDVEDGIFKLLSDKAKCNYEDSKKTVEVINIEQQTRDLFEKYCFKIENELSTNESVELYSKSRMHIRKVNRKKDGSAYSLQLAKDATSSPQGLKVDIVVRDFHDFKEGKIKSASDVKPSYDSQSSSHGNAIYYFELYKRLAEFEKTQKQETVTEKTELKNYVLIIDEINRGNVSRIFGELITLLEADKRIGGEYPPIKVTLPYSKESFGVPCNLYIIGTMNTTDRSVGNIDYAVRRRFAFVTLESKRQVLVDKYGEGSRQAALFDAVYTFLNDDKKHVEMDIEDLMVGHSYFMASDDNLQLKLDYEIVPLIREYYKDGIIKVSKKDLDEAIEEWNNILK